ncbi:prepilin peptidase [Alphaproteobacteria bacterium]|nr:prepilin peptidase [Alphaproteobacteria bacterium]
MLSLVVFLSCLFVVCAVGVLASLSDLRGLTIPNIYTVIVGGAFAVCYAGLYIFGGADVLPSLVSSLIAAVIFFGITFAMFSLKMLGAADSKLGTAFALWVGLSGLPPFLFYMTIAGGVLAVVSLVLRKWAPVKSAPEGGWVHMVQSGHSKVPYGVAIFAGVLASFADLGYFKYETFVSFMSAFG